LSILPIHLKAETLFYIYKFAIDTIKILQEKDQRFYAQYLVMFSPMRIKQGTVLLNEGCQPYEVYFLLTGCILKESSVHQQLGLKPHYFIEGAMFGERDILQSKLSSETYTAMCDCYLIALNK